MRCIIAAIRGSEVAVASDNLSDLGPLCGEFDFNEFGTMGEGWQSEHAVFDAVARRESEY
jgi:hypothetical protein